MTTDKSQSSILVVTQTEKMTAFFAELLPEDKFTPILSVANVNEARRLLVDRSVDIVVINSPLPDEFGTQFALELSEKQNCGILMFVKAELLDNVSQKVEEFGILTLPKPVSRQMVFQSVKLLTATRQKIKTFEGKTASLEAKMEDIRIVNRAKLILIEHLKMSEPEAHRYIEKTAMDRCTKKREIAEDIIRTYGG